MFGFTSVAEADPNSSSPQRRNSPERRTYTTDKTDEREVDYDEEPTELYKLIENKDWDSAIIRIDTTPIEVNTWVYRREVSDATRIRWRLLPIHATCIFRSPLSVIEALVEAYEDGAKMKDDQGMLPLHLACRNGASKGVVITITNAFPEAIFVKDRKQRTPLDIVAAGQSQNREAVMFALNKYKHDLERKGIVGVGVWAGETVAVNKNGVKAATLSSPGRVDLSQAPEVDYENRTLLFRLIMKGDWALATRRAEKIAEEAETWIVTKGFNCNLRFLPLHKACVLQPPEAFIEALIVAHPNGARSPDQDGWLPLHCACFYDASESVINALLVANPKAAGQRDEEGRLPLHYACLRGSSEGAVRVLVGANPRAGMCKDDEGRLPLHHACSKGAPCSTIEAVLRAAPRAASSKDDQGRVPLHHACRKGAHEDVVEALLKVCPRGSGVKDDQDKLPIHYACSNGASEGVLLQLLDAFPESVNMKNGFGYTPLQEVKALNNPSMSGIISILERLSADNARTSSQEDIENAMEGNKIIIALKKQVEVLCKRVSFLEVQIDQAVIKKNEDGSEEETPSSEEAVLPEELVSPSSNKGATSTKR